MTSLEDRLTLETATQNHRVAKWRVWAAWAVILLSLGYFVVLSTWEKEGGGAEQSTYVQQELTAQYALGVHLLKLDATAETADGMVKTVKESAKSPREMVRAAVVLGELQGPEQALAELKGIGGEKDKGIVLDVAFLQGVYAGENLQGDEADRFIKRHGWFGELAAVYGRPAGDNARQAAVYAAEKTTVVIFAALVVGVIGLGLGLVALAGAIVLLVMGKIKRSYAASPNDVIDVALLEGFACYLALMAGVSIAGPLIPESWPRWVHFAGLVGMMPVVLFFARWRGAGWREMAARCGLTWGKGLFWEMGWGVAGYIAALPVMALGMVATAVLVKAGGVDASHPIIEAVAGADKWRWLLIWTLACVWAPLTEEFMFRGMFFGVLRGRWGWAVSAGIVSLIFAGLHPQGWAAIPVLGSLAMALAAMREWRGSLIAGMTAHALNNALAMGFLMLCVS